MKKHLKFNEHSHGLAQVNKNSTLMIEFPWQGPYISLICQNLTRKSCECFIAETTLELLGIRERSLHNTLYVNNLRWQLRTFALEKHLPRGEHVALPQTTTIFSHTKCRIICHIQHIRTQETTRTVTDKRGLFLSLDLDRILSCLHLFIWVGPDNKAETSWQGDPTIPPGWRTCEKCNSISSGAVQPKHFEKHQWLFV